MPGRYDTALQEAVEDAQTANLENFLALLTSDLTPPQRVEALLANAMRSFHENYPQVFVYLQEDMTRIGSRKDPWARKMLEQTRTFEKAMITLIEDGINAGYFRSDLDSGIVSSALWGMINWTHRWYRPDKHDPEEVARTFAALILGGLESEAADSAAAG